MQKQKEKERRKRKQIDDVLNERARVEKLLKEEIGSAEIETLHKQLQGTTVLLEELLSVPVVPVLEDIEGEEERLALLLEEKKRLEEEKEKRKEKRREERKKKRKWKIPGLAGEEVPCDRGEDEEDELDEILSDLQHKVVISTLSVEKAKAAKKE